MTDGYWLQALHMLVRAREHLEEEGQHLAAAADSASEALNLAIAAASGGEPGNMLIGSIQEKMAVLEQLQANVAGQVESCNGLISRLSQGA